MAQVLCCVQALQGGSRRRGCEQPFPRLHGVHALHGVLAPAALLGKVRMRSK